MNEKLKIRLVSMKDTDLEVRNRILKEGGGPPSDIQEHKIKGQEWAKRAGWQ